MPGYIERHRGLWRPERRLVRPRLCSALSIQHLAGFGAGGFDYRANGVRFDGTNDYGARGAQLTGAADSSQLLCSFWLKPASDGTALDIFGNSGALGDGFHITRLADNKLRLNVSTPGGAGNAIRVANTAATFTSAAWKHFALAYNNAAPEVYVDGAADAYTDGSATGTADFTQTDTWVGGISAAASLNAEIADFYWAPGQYLALASNIGKFTLAGKPVSLGADGSLPTGTAPIVFLSGATASWHTNKGTGGGFTLTGALADAATSPSD